MARRAPCATAKHKLQLPKLLIPLNASIKTKAIRSLDFLPHLHITASAVLSTLTLLRWVSPSSDSPRHLSRLSWRQGLNGKADRIKLLPAEQTDEQRRQCPPTHSLQSNWCVIRKPSKCRGHVWSLWSVDDDAWDYLVVWTLRKHNCSSKWRVDGKAGFGKISRKAAAADPAAVSPFLRMRYGEAHPCCFRQMAFSSMRRSRLLFQITHQKLAGLCETYWILTHVKKCLKVDPKMR